MLERIGSLILYQDFCDGENLALHKHGEAMEMCLGLCVYVCVCVCVCVCACVCVCVFMVVVTTRSCVCSSSCRIAEPSLPHSSHCQFKSREPHPLRGCGWTPWPHLLLVVSPLHELLVELEPWVGYAHPQD